MQYESHVSRFMQISSLYPESWTSVLCIPSSFSLLFFLIVSQNFYFLSQGLHCADLVDLLAFFAPIVSSLVLWLITLSLAFDPVVGLGRSDTPHDVT